MSDPSRTKTARTEEVFDGNDRVVRTYHPNGTLVEETRWPPSDDTLVFGAQMTDHVTIRWSSDGELLGRYEIRDGAGEQVQWYDNGQVAGTIRVFENMRTGMLRGWDEEGCLLVERCFFRNESVSKKRYRELQALHPEIPQYTEEDFRSVTQKRMDSDS